MCRSEVPALLYRDAYQAGRAFSLLAGVILTVALSLVALGAVPIFELPIWSALGVFFLIVGLWLLPAPNEVAEPDAWSSIFAEELTQGEPRALGAVAREPVHEVEQLLKEALESKAPNRLIEFIDFCGRFRRLAAFNALLVQIQRPGSVAIASPAEWERVNRTVLPDAIPIMILKPFGPVEWVYELSDTHPPVDRDSIKDPFSATTCTSYYELERALARLIAGCGVHKSFRIRIEAVRMGFDFAGSARPALSDPHPLPLPPEITTWAHSQAAAETWRGPDPVPNSSSVSRPIAHYRVRVNDRMTAAERLVTIAHELGHIFCGHLGSCTSREHGRAGWPDRRDRSPEEKEIEAEAVAWAIGKRAGIVCGSATYIAHHLRTGANPQADTEIVARAIGRVESLAGLSYGSG